MRKVLSILLSFPIVISGFIILPPRISRNGIFLSGALSDKEFEIESVALKTGVSFEVLSRFPSKKGLQKPPLIFVHGSFHSAWCWTEKWMEFFVERDYPVLAISLRGTNGSFAGDGVTKVKIDEHAADIQAFLYTLNQTKEYTTSNRPILISHSFGGAAVMKYMETFPAELDSLSASIFLCSVPPSGNGPMTMRFLRRSLIQSWKITSGFALKKCIQNADLCRDLFFGGPKIETVIQKEDGSVETTVHDYGVSDDDIKRYQSYFERDTAATIDVSDFVKQLPSKKWNNGKAPFISDLPPCLVCGATRDFLVDQEGVDETAKYFGVESVFIDSPHDVMLGEKWQEGADVIFEWLESKVL